MPRPGALPHRECAPSSRAGFSSLDLASGREEPYRDFVPADATGIVDLFSIDVTRDARYYAYSDGRVLSDLHLVEGLK